jgi:UDP-glucuronate decarboxylase
MFNHKFFVTVLTISKNNIIHRLCHLFNTVLKFILQEKFVITRSFCYVDDLIDAMIRFMELSGEPSESAFPGPLNLGNPTEFTIRQLAEKVMAITGANSRIVFRPLPSDDPVQRQPDISRARSLLAWEPKVRLEEGLSRTVAYFKELLNPAGQ